MTYSAQKPRYRFGPPRGKTAPQYKGTKAVSDYPFGKRLKTDKFCTPRYERAGSELEDRLSEGKKIRFGRCCTPWRRCLPRCLLFRGGFGRGV
jgi:hypothetical protein